MRVFLFAIFIFFSFSSISQSIDSVKIPRGVVYKYCDPAIVEKAKTLVLEELGNSPTYKLDGGVLFVGPILWTRYKNVRSLAAIPGGNVTINFNKEQLDAKMTQDADGFAKVWNELRKEVSLDQLKLRKATHGELQYYWAVISFDIEEPLLIAETNEHRYILNISPGTLKLLWLDEVPPAIK